MPLYCSRPPWVVCLTVRPQRHLKGSQKNPRSWRQDMGCARARIYSQQFPKHRPPGLLLSILPCRWITTTKHDGEHHNRGSLESVMQNVRESMKTQRTNPGRVRCQVLRMLDYLVARAPTFVQELAREARLSTVVPTRSIPERNETRDRPQEMRRNSKATCAAPPISQPRCRRSGSRERVGWDRHPNRQPSWPPPRAVRHCPANTIRHRTRLACTR